MPHPLNNDAYESKNKISTVPTQYTVKRQLGWNYQHGKTWLNLTLILGKLNCTFLFINYLDNTVTMVAVTQIKRSLSVFSETITHTPIQNQFITSLTKEVVFFVLNLLFSYVSSHSLIILLTCLTNL